jgi:hypothetical protein
MENCVQFHRLTILFYRMSIMNKKLFLVAVLCLGFFATTGFAQPSGLRPPGGFEQLGNSPIAKSVMKNEMRSFWDGSRANYMILPFLMGYFVGHDSESHQEIQTAFGVSDEQLMQIAMLFENQLTELGKNPEYMKLRDEEMQALTSFPSYPYDPFQRNLDEETKAKLAKIPDIQAKKLALEMDYLTNSVDKILESETKQKIMEAQLANMGEIPIFLPKVFDALKLTDDQKQQMERIKKEIESEFEKQLENVVNDQLILACKWYAEMDKIEASNDWNEWREKLQALQKKMEEDIEYKKILEKISTQKKQFTTQFNTKMFDVLTDEQWKRLQSLITHPPEHAKVFLKSMKAHRNEAEQVGVCSLEPDSWKPGHAIPELYRR